MRERSDGYWKKSELAVCYNRPKYSFCWIIWSHPRYIRVKIKHKSENLYTESDCEPSSVTAGRVSVSVDVSCKTFLSFAAQLWEDAWNSSQITTSIIHDEDERNDKVPWPSSEVSVQVKCGENRTFTATELVRPFSALFSGKSDSFFYKAIQSVRSSHGYLTFNERVMWCERAWICASIKYFLFIFSTLLLHSTPTPITLHRSSHSRSSTAYEVVFMTNFYYYKLFTNASERDWSSHMSWNEAKLCNWKTLHCGWSVLLFNFEVEIKILLFTLRSTNDRV